MLEWFETFRTELAALSEEEVAANAAALAQQFIEPDRSLDEQHERYSTELLLSRYDFGRRERRAAAVEALDKATILRLWDAMIGAPDRRLVKLHFHKGKGVERGEEHEQERGVVVTNLAEVRRFKDGCAEVLC